MKIINKHGQSIVEYALIALLVILGIVFMGAYVLRSVDAHFKLWDDGVQDSFEENLNQAPNTVIPFVNLQCNCSFTNGECGGTSGSTCGWGNREVDYSCSFQSCNPAGITSSCVPDNSCCGNTTPECGNFALPVYANGQVNYTPPTSPPPSQTNCYYGQSGYFQECGASNSIICQSAISTCPLPECVLGHVAIPNSTRFCATLTTAPPRPPIKGLTKDSPVTYVNEQLSTDCASPQYEDYCVGTCHLNSIPNTKCTSTSTSCYCNCLSSCTYCPPTTAASCQVYCANGYSYDPNLNECILAFTVADYTSIHGDQNGPRKGHDECSETASNSLNTTITYVNPNSNHSVIPCTTASNTAPCCNVYASSNHDSGSNSFEVYTVINNQSYIETFASPIQTALIDGPDQCYDSPNPPPYAQPGESCNILLTYPPN